MGGCMVGCFKLRVAPGFLHGKDREAKSQGDVGGAQQERSGPQTVVGGDVAGGQGCAGDTQVAGRFVQAHGEAAALRADKVHFHHDGG